MAKKWTVGRAFPLMLGAAVLVGVVVVGLSSYQRRAVALEASTKAANLAAIDGPPCPSLTAAEFDAKPIKPKKAFVFNEVRYDRRFGHVDCNTVAVGRGNAYEPVCQFSSPALLAVTTRKGQFFFAPGVGKPVTIITQDGTPRCVMDGNFRPELS
ncbi:MULTISPECIES: hypothetical protein [Phenylobacterium]|uniref:Uncharacterized protein n=1 Tax=Phenylobacterium koreense TaxID=266125 RepID=A0ABV2EHY1_9CAUL